MRDPNRIPQILEVLRGVWERHPDWRLGQLIGNAISPRTDPYYVEDDDMERQLWRLMEPDLDVVVVADAAERIGRA